MSDKGVIVASDEAVSDEGVVVAAGSGVLSNEEVIGLLRVRLCLTRE